MIKLCHRNIGTAIQGPYIRGGVAAAWYDYPSSMPIPARDDPASFAGVSPVALPRGTTRWRCSECSTEFCQDA